MWALDEWLTEDKKADMIEVNGKEGSRQTIAPQFRVMKRQQIFIL
jgi:hypothetical protein